MTIRGRLQGLTVDRNGTKFVTIATRSEISTEYDELYDREIKCEIKPFRAKRSLDANAYFWTLLDKLSAKTGIPKLETYRSYIREIGDNAHIGCYEDKDVASIRRDWERNGIGWVTDIFPSKIKGCTNVVLYTGSSEYDSSQMARLIEMVVQDCKEQNIETKTPQELNLLLENWRQK